MTNGKPRYKMTININVLNHLGIGLYSSVPAVLSELVANAWDADANVVEIVIEPERNRIVITDDGVGMTYDEVNNKYLHVGYQRRKHSTFTPSGRHVMGRKGIGKLSVFAIAREVEVHTVSGTEANGLRMDRKEIRDLMNEGGQARDYHPTPVPASSIAIKKGTEITLKEFDKNISWTESHLRRRLARRFSVIGPSHNFEVKVQNEPISPKDRDYYSKLEFVWQIGNSGDALEAFCTNAVEFIEVDGFVGTVKESILSRDNEDSQAEETANEKHRPLTVTGWLGTVDRPDSIDSNNNAIVLLAHGKLIHEDLLPYFQESGIYADYVIGEINADFLDADDLQDIVTSARQSVKEIDPRFRMLLKYIGARLKEIKSKWTDLRRTHGAQKALTNPILKDWYERWEGDNRKAAERLFAKIESLRVGDAEAKMELYRGGLLAFEKLALKHSLSKLKDLETERDFRVLSKLFGDIDEVEAVHYYQIAKGRISVIKEFSELTPIAKESVLQQYLFDHLWLLDASWERAATNPRIEEAVTTEFKKVGKELSTDEKAGRIDIRYRTAAGKHIIIELKKYNTSVSASALSGQVQKYRRALTKCLAAQFPNEPTDIEIVCVLGRPPSPRDDVEANRAMLRSVGARWYTYDQLIKDALDSYRDYLKGQKRVHELVEIIERLAESIQDEHGS